MAKKTKMTALQALNYLYSAFVPGAADLYPGELKKVRRDALRIARQIQTVLSRKDKK